MQAIVSMLDRVLGRATASPGAKLPSTERLNYRPESYGAENCDAEAQASSSFDDSSAIAAHPWLPMRSRGLGMLVLKGAVLAGAIAAMVAARNWWIDQTMPPPRQVKIQQTWELEPGERIADYRIIGGLGDISLALQGARVRAPFAGEVYPYQDRCVLFSSPEVPAYMFRLCGLQQVAFGEIRQGAAIGRARSLHFATLRKQPDGSWAIVEPARDILEQLLRPGQG